MEPDRWKLENGERIAQAKLSETMLADVPIIEPLRSSIQKVGRHEPCPCGFRRKVTRKTMAAIAHKLLLEGHNLVSRKRLLTIEQQ